MRGERKEWNTHNLFFQLEYNVIVIDDKEIKKGSTNTNTKGMIVCLNTIYPL
jgi:hypothetical protein